jgi:hypothetical protein
MARARTEGCSSQTITYTTSRRTTKESLRLAIINDDLGAETPPRAWGKRLG